jgi:hypothetical protein
LLLFDFDNWSEGARGMRGMRTEGDIPVLQYEVRGTVRANAGNRNDISAETVVVSVRAGPHPLPAHLLSQAGNKARSSFVRTMTSTLEILLDPPYKRTDFKAHLFIPRDAVSGEVVLDLKDDEKISSISIELKGKCKTDSFFGRDGHFYELEIFSQRKTLFQGPFKLRASTYKYPFSLPFPERFEYKRTDFIEDPQLSAQTRLVSHPLPPTCEDNTSSGKCSIYYSLSVKIPRSIGSWEDKVSLNFTPHRSESSPTPLLAVSKHTKLYQQFRLTNEGIPRPLTSRERMSETFHRHAKTHTVNFSLSALAPTAIVIGKPYEIEVAVVCEDMEEGPGILRFQMKDYSLSLKTRTDVCGLGTTYESGTRLLGDIPLSSGNLDLPLAINQPVQLNDMFPSNLYYAPPSFASVVAKRSYGLELKAKITCIGKDFKCNIYWPNVTLYPARMAFEMSGGSTPIEAGIANLGLVNQERLPSYGDVTRLPLPVYESVPTGNI